MTTVLDRLREALAPEYEVEREIARGGMGMVFLAREVVLDRQVAIKVIRPELATARAAEKFLSEARHSGAPGRTGGWVLLLRDGLRRG
jgi:serine/threonine protein kinase